MLKRLLLTSASMVLFFAPVLAQTPKAPAAGEARQFTPPPSANDQRTPGAPAMLQKRLEDAAVAAPAGEVLSVETSSQIRAESLIGKKVVNPSGEELGVVDDIVISKDGKVSGLVVKTGAVMGIGGKSVAIAWRDVASAIESEAVTLPLSKDQLEQAPEFTTKEDRAKGDSALPRLPAK